MPDTRKLRVGILGATGMVGQRFIQLLDGHALFEVAVLGASERSAGQTYRNACAHWKMDTEIPEHVASMIVQPCAPEKFAGCAVVFSGLDSSVARDIEGAFRQANHVVFSNSKNHRMDEDVPLVVPFVNPEHMRVIRHQRRRLGLSRGCIITNANCSTTGVVVPLKPLHDAFGLAQVQVMTLQAISGAGYPGIASMDILGNVVPYIGDEEPKIESEPQKILGAVNSNETGFVPTEILIDACCHRVPVVDGHTETVCVKFKRHPAPSIDEVRQVLESYVSEAQRMGPHATTTCTPMQLIRVMSQENRPQPRLDLMYERGYGASVGRLRRGHYWDAVFTVLSHNTILGAAGSSILNAEIAYRKGWLDEK